MMIIYLILSDKLAFIFLQINWT